MDRRILKLIAVMTLGSRGCIPSPAIQADEDAADPPAVAELNPSIDRLPMGKEEPRFASSDTVKVTELIEQTKSPDPILRAMAARELGRAGQHAVAAIPYLIRLLTDIEAGPSTEAYCAIREIGKPAVGLLTNAVRDRDSMRRSTAASLLGEIGGAAAVEPLVSLLDDADEGVQRTSIRALRDLADMRAVTSLIGYMNNRRNRDFLRGRAAWALGVFRVPSAVDALVAKLEDEGDRPYVRYEAAVALGRIGDGSALETLRSMTENKNSTVREGIFWGLAQSGRSGARLFFRHAMMDKREALEVRRAAAIGLGRSQEPGDLDYLMRMVDDGTEDLAIRQAALAGLALSKNATAQRRVFAALKGDSVPMLVVAAAVMRYVEGPEAVTPLLEALNHHNAVVRCLAAKALGQRKEGQSLAFLKALLHDPNADVAYSAKEAIAQIRGVRCHEIDEKLSGTAPSFPLYDAELHAEIFGPLQLP